MNSLKKNLFVFVFAAFATTACFSMETNTKHILTFDNNNGIETKITTNQDPCFSNFYKYEIFVQIANNSSAPITVSAKLFKNISQTHINKMDQIKNAILIPFITGLYSGSLVTGISSVMLYGYKYLSNYIEHLHKYPQQQYMCNHIPQISSVIGGIGAVVAAILYYYDTYKIKSYFDGISREQTIQPNKVGLFVTYISKSDFEKLEKGLLIPELDIKKAEQPLADQAK